LFGTAVALSWFGPLVSDSCYRKQGAEKMSDESKTPSDDLNKAKIAGDTQSANQTPNALLTDEALDGVAGGRITNIRINVNGITQG
jgi:hypothetical protein